MADKPDLESAYALETPEDSQRLYAAWADTYESGYAAETGYNLHVEVAQAFVRLGVAGPVLDLGAGTGLVGAALVQRGVTMIDGTDISAEMLAQAETKDIYRHLFEGDLTQRLSVEDQAYAGAVSAGTFTNGHVGPTALREVLRVVAPGGWIVISVNVVHWAAKGFEAELDRLTDVIAEMRKEEVDIYADGTGPHGQDRAFLLFLRRV